MSNIKECEHKASFAKRYFERLNSWLDAYKKAQEVSPMIALLVLTQMNRDLELMALDERAKDHKSIDSSELVIPVLKLKDFLKT